MCFGEYSLNSQTLLQIKFPWKAFFLGMRDNPSYKFCAYGSVVIKADGEFYLVLPSAARCRWAFSFKEKELSSSDLYPLKTPNIKWEPMQKN